MADEKHKLVSFIKDDLFRTFKSDREREVEPIWSLAYDAFRGKYDSANLKRWKELEGFDWRSKVFVRLTKVKIIGAVSNIEDVYFQTGGKIPFDCKPTKKPEFLPGMFMDPEQAKFGAERMKEKIDDIFTETRYERTLMSSILEMAIYGVAFHKSPVVRPKKYARYVLQPPQLPPETQGMYFPPEMLAQYGRYALQESEKMLPTVEHPNVWDIFWDFEGSSVEDGQGIIHRKMMSIGQLRSLLEMEGYDREAIIAVIESKSGRTGDSDANEDPRRTYLTNPSRNIQVLEFEGRVPVKYLKGTDLDNGKLDGREAEIFVTIADDKIIRKPALNPLPMGRRRLKAAKWEEIPHEIQGVGIAENIQDSQMMVNGAVRCFIDNKSLAGSLMFAINRRNLAPGQDDSMYPGRIWDMANHVRDVREGIQGFAPPDIGAGMLDVINLFREFADTESNLPSIMQGMQERQTPKTAFAFSRLLELSNKQLGKVIRNIDEGHVEPDVEAMYHYLMATDPDDSIKGDYDLEATGFGAFKDRVMQADNVQNFLLFCLSNQLIAMLTDIPYGTRELAVLRGLDPDKWFPKEQQEKLQAMLAQPTMVATDGSMGGGTGGAPPPPGRPGVFPEPPRAIPAQ